ncbi:MAG TPA: dihydroorotase [Chitinophagaceae bacterium]|nr:dihydroorotase [Chitinophagaceae bacterium]
MSILITNIGIVNEGNISYGDVYVKHERIEKIAAKIEVKADVTEIDGTGLLLLPGVIDDQVHFREPGLTHKATIHTESMAAVAGGVTSFMEMPNTMPPAFTQALLEQKYTTAAATSVANYSFFMGTSNDNIDEILKVNEKKNEICGVKIFMGSSTGNLLVDNMLALEKVFAGSEVLIATHCEEESIIRDNLRKYKADYNTILPAHHALIRNEEACFESSLKAIQLAQKHGSRLHILHISTAKELQLFSNMLPLKDKRITSEVCVHHLHFTANDYETLGNRIKCNPAIKAAHNKTALWEALLDDRLDVIATDHAPHTLAEKGFERTTDGVLIPVENATYEQSHAGLPLVQHSLLLMLHYVQQGNISIEKVVQKMSHAVADCFDIKERGYLREGYFADMVLVDMHQSSTVTPKSLYYKCGWSPLEGFTFPATIHSTYVNGNLAYGNGAVVASTRGKRLLFDRK